MNKAITDGLVFTPPAFANGLDQWSSGDGAAGADTYATAPNAAFVPADEDFGGALEIQKTATVQKLRCMVQTPILPGCYLRIRTRVKVLSGSLPGVRIAGWAGGAGDVHVGGLTETGPEIALSQYGEAVEISAIVGVGNRGGVDMVWGAQPLYGHFGLDLTGPNGAVVRIDDFEIEDISGAFLQDMLGLVDVRDYGAKGDGVTDDSAAFEAADAAAAGRTVLISEGVFHLATGVTFQNPVHFQGSVDMPTDQVLSLTRNFTLPSYEAAFGGEEAGFRKAFQALLNNADHNILDLGGRNISLSAPIDMQAAVANKTEFAQQRMIQNGRFSPIGGAAWDTEVATSQATYDINDPYTLSNVANAAAIQTGSLVTGSGVGREVYVSSVNVTAQKITLSNALYDAAGSQVYTFKRFKYLLDFSGFTKLSKFILQNIEFYCDDKSSAILLPPVGGNFHVRDCHFAQPKDRAITSHAKGCQGMNIDNCKFLSSEFALPATERQTIGFNVNESDVKLRHNRAIRFKHFGVLAGSSSLILGNHCFQGDGAGIGPRTAGLVLTLTNNRATINGNYICDSSIEWSNEHDPDPTHSSGFSFSSLSITGNVFLSQSTASWFNFIHVRPFGSGHYINGLIVTGNTFRLFQNNIDRVEGIDDSYASMEFDKFTNITFRDNAFHNVNIKVTSPLVMKHVQDTAAATWVVKPSPKLPFKAWAQTVESIVPSGPMRDENDAQTFEMPYYLAKQGANNDEIHLKWSKPVSGSVMITIRIDDPL